MPLIRNISDAEFIAGVSYLYPGETREVTRGQIVEIGRYHPDRFIVIAEAAEADDDLLPGSTPAIEQPTEREPSTPRTPLAPPPRPDRHARRGGR